MTISEIISFFINIQIDPAVFLSFLILILSLIFLILDKTNKKIDFNFKIITFILFFSLILILCFIFISNKRISKYKIIKLKEKKFFNIKNIIKLEKLKENYFYYYEKYSNNKNKNNNLKNITTNNNKFKDINLYSNKGKFFLYQIFNILYNLYIKISSKIVLMVNETSLYFEKKYNKYYLNK